MYGKYLKYEFCIFAEVWQVSLETTLNCFHSGSELWNLCPPLGGWSR